MTLPLYMLRRLAAPGGNRLRKLDDPKDSAGICPVCLKDVLWTKINNVSSLTGRWIGDNVYHWPCIPKQVYQMSPIGPRKDGVSLGRGNLDTAEYRYWIGAPDVWSRFSMCRACRTTVYGKEERETHTNNEALAVGGDRCAARLVAAYKLLSENPACLICNKSRFNHTKWGVPICNSLECIESWMFDQERIVKLEFRLEQQKRKAAATIKANSAIVQILPPRSWCRICGMFTDNVGHDDEHIRRIQSGSYDEGCYD